MEALTDIFKTIVYEEIEAKNNQSTESIK